MDLDYENIEDINWEYIKAKRKPLENKERTEELIRNFDPFGIKKFKEVLLKIKEELENELKINDNNKKDESENEEKELDEDEVEFNNEIKRRNRNNIIKIYEKFKLRKGIE